MEGPGLGKILPVAWLTGLPPGPDLDRGPPTPLRETLEPGPRLALPSTKTPGTDEALQPSSRLHSCLDSHLQQGRPHLPMNSTPARLPPLPSLPACCVAKLLIRRTHSPPPNQPQAPPTRLPAALATRQSSSGPRPHTAEPETSSQEAPWWHHVTNDTGSVALAFRDAWLSFWWWWWGRGGLYCWLPVSTTF